MSMKRWTCKQCKKFFTRDVYGKRRAYFCGKACNGLYRKRHPGVTAFKHGHVPWNRNKKGIHLSPGSEWKKGRISNRRVPVGTVRVRKDKHGKFRAFIKIADPSKWKEHAIYVWQRSRKKRLPIGYVIHHKDGKTLNDSPTNLQAVTRAHHVNIHRDEILLARRKNRAKRVVQ